MSTARDLLTNYQHVISDQRLVTGSNGIYDVRVDGELIYSKDENGRHAEDGEVLEIFKEIVGPDVATFGA